MNSNSIIQNLQIQLPTPVERVHYEPFNTHGISVFVKRDDVIHPIICGNKFRKLQYNLDKFYQKQYHAILSFGGAFSNHLLACGYVCKGLDIPFIAVIRGEESATPSPVIKQLQSWGATLSFVSRADYNLKTNEHYLAELRAEFGTIFIVPEGGANYEGTLGCAAILTEQTQNFNYIALAAGTGTTTLGILPVAAKTNSKILAVQVLKGENYLYNEIKARLSYTYFDSEFEAELLENLTVLDSYHCGGYAKTNTELIDFITDFEAQTDIKLDKIYTGKMFLALKKEIEKGNILPNSSVLAIHTGGLFEHNYI